MRLRPVVAVAVALSIVLSATAAFAGDGNNDDTTSTEADSTSPQPSVTLGVSVPPDPIVASPGTTASQLIRVTNQGHNDVNVEFHQRAVDLGDEGQVTILDEPDPLWGSRLKLPEGIQTVPAEGYKDYDVQFTIPDDVAPDIYLIAFLVTPVQETPGQIKVINQIASFLTLDVPGPRDWRVDAELDLPSLAFGSKADGELRVENLGRSSLRFWGDITKKISPWGTVDQDRIPHLYLPVGKQRSVEITATPRFGIGIVEVPVRVSYPSGVDGATSKEILLTKRVFVIHPLWLVALSALVLLLLVYAWRRLHRRPNTPKQAPAAGR